MKIFVQSKKLDPAVPFNINAVICLDGFVQRGHYAEFFSLDEIDATPFRREEPVLGGVGTYKRIFDKLGVTWERLSYPTLLQDFMGREAGIIKMHELPGLLTKRLVFIKPANDDKRFTGFVCKHEDDCWNPKLCSMEPNSLLVWSDPVTFVSEYRVYVMGGDIQNICRYRGPAHVQPDVQVIREMISAYTDAPISYGLDVGVLSDGRTVLVEVNEALALGNYGLPSMLQAKMVAARWFEIMGDKSQMAEEAESSDSPPYINQFSH